MPVCVYFLRCLSPSICRALQPAPPAKGTALSLPPSPPPRPTGPLTGSALPRFQADAKGNATAAQLPQAPPPPHARAAAALRGGGAGAAAAAAAAVPRLGTAGTSRLPLPPHPPHHPLLMGGAGGHSATLHSPRRPVARALFMNVSAYSACFS